MMYKAGHQKVEIPQKRDPECLPDNYDMVVKRMMITEKELLQDDKTANEFNQIIERSCQNFGERSWNWKQEMVSFTLCSHQIK